MDLVTGGSRWVDPAFGDGGRLPAAHRRPPAAAPLPRLAFITPDRAGLPALDAVCVAAAPRRASGGSSGYTEASRGCKHLCRHCPIVPVYDGQFRVVQAEVVLADIRAQVAAGAQHITFGDPDFLNGPTHARRIVEALAREWPGLTYDVTIKVEHLAPAPRPAAACCATPAACSSRQRVESVDDAVLARLEKGHTRADFERAAADRAGPSGCRWCRPSSRSRPWTTLDDYFELLDAIDGSIWSSTWRRSSSRSGCSFPGGRGCWSSTTIRRRIGAFDPAQLALHVDAPGPARRRAAARRAWRSSAAGSPPRGSRCSMPSRHSFGERAGRCAQPNAPRPPTRRAGSRAVPERALVLLSGADRKSSWLFSERQPESELQPGCHAPACFSSRRRPAIRRGRSATRPSASGVELAFATDRCKTLDDPWRDRAIPIRFHDEPGSVAAIVREAARRAVRRACSPSATGRCDCGARRRRSACRSIRRTAARAAHNKRLARERLRAAGLPVPWFARTRSTIRRRSRDGRGAVARASSSRSRCRAAAA